MGDLMPAEVKRQAPFVDSRAASASNLGLDSGGAWLPEDVEVRGVWVESVLDRLDEEAEASVDEAACSFSNWAVMRLPISWAKACSLPRSSPLGLESRDEREGDACLLSAELVFCFALLSLDA